MTTTNQPKSAGRPKSDNPRTELVTIRATKEEHEFWKRCASHASMGRGDNLSAFVRHLFIEYAAQHGIEYRPAPKMPVSDSPWAHPLPMPAMPYLPREQSDLEADLDPDRFDDSNTSTMDPLPDPNALDATDET